MIDHIFLQIDGNGTVVIGDSTKKVNTLLSEVAGAIFAKWDEANPEMSYKDYIQKVLYPGNKYDHAIKKLQEEKLGRLLEELQEQNHPCYPEAAALYGKLAESYLDEATGSVKFTIFPSMLKLFKKVNEACRCSLALRTFGPDGPVIAEEFRKNGIAMQREATMINEGMKLNGSQEVVTGDALLQTFEQEHIACRDIVDEWFSHNREAAHGKVIPCLKDGNWNGKRVLTIFLDDNLNKQSSADPKEKNIAWPRDIRGRPASWDDQGIIGIRINSVKAATDEDYMIKKINKQLLKRGINPL